MKYLKIEKENVSNGTGIRTVLWVSGCEHHCKGCHNPETWDPEAGYEFTDESIQEILNSLEPEYISGLSITGGDPLHPNNREEILNLTKVVKEKFPDKEIWMWTGYLYEDVREWVKFTDVLIDGPFIEAQKDLTLAWRGSSNQRIINLWEEN